MYPCILPHSHRFFKCLGMGLIHFVEDECKIREVTLYRFCVLHLKLPMGSLCSRTSLTHRGQLMSLHYKCCGLNSSYYFVPNTTLHGSPLCPFFKLSPKSNTSPRDLATNTSFIAVILWGVTLYALILSVSAFDLVSKKPPSEFPACVTRQQLSNFT